MKEWFDSLEPRERRIIVYGGIVLLLMSIYFLGWEPFIHNLNNLEKSTREKQADLAWMQSAAQEVKILSASSSRSNAPASGQSLLGVIDRSAKAKKLNENVKRVQPDGSDKARVWMENVQFDVVIRWLEELQTRNGIIVESTMIEKQEEPGLINARIVFQAASEQ